MPIVLLWSSFCIVFFCLTGLAKHRDQVSKDSCHVFYSGSQHDSAPPVLLRQIEVYKQIFSLSEVNDRSKDLENIRVKLSELSITTQRKLFKMIRDVYTLTIQYKYAPNAPIKKLKRNFDYILSLKSEAFEYFSTQLRQNPERWEDILQIYFNKQATRSGLLNSIDVSNILYIAYAMQDMIKSDPKFAKATIYLYGSMINGRGLSGVSDLDYSVSDMSLLSKLESDVVKFPGLDNLQLSHSEGHRVLPKDSHQYGFLNPLVIVVHAEYIELRVYKRLPHSAYSQKPEFFTFSAN